MTELHNHAIAEELLRLRNRSGLSVTAEGICSNLSYHIREDDGPDSGEWLEAAFSELGLDITYPVPHPTMSNAMAYINTRDCWDGSYGENRLYLLELLILLAEGWEPPEYFKVYWPHPSTKETK